MYAIKHVHVNMHVHIQVKHKTQEKYVKLRANKSQMMLEC